MLAFSEKDRDLMVNFLSGIVCKPLDGANIMQIVGLLNQLPTIPGMPAPGVPVPPAPPAAPAQPVADGSNTDTPQG